MVRATAEFVGIMSVMEDFGHKTKKGFYVDASAAFGITQRHGIGKIRNLQTNGLQMQKKKIKEATEVINVHGSLNLADIKTKNVSRELIHTHTKAIGCTFRESTFGETCSNRKARRLARVLNV